MLFDHFNLIAWNSDDLAIDDLEASVDWGGTGGEKLVVRCLQDIAHELIGRRVIPVDLSSKEDFGQWSRIDASNAKVLGDGIALWQAGRGEAARLSSSRQFTGCACSLRHIDAGNKECSLEELLKNWISATDRYSRFDFWKDEFERELSILIIGCLLFRGMISRRSAHLELTNDFQAIMTRHGVC